MIGKEISHYKITEEIGKGGMGVVYKGFDTRLKRFAAIKILPKEFTSDKERKVRFFQEALAASHVSHPNIAHIYDIGEEGGVSFIAMEYVEGETLRSAMSKGKMPLQDSLLISSQVADALAKAHESGIVHRDIKPENIMITKDGYVKVLDFGLAKVTEMISAIPLEDEAETIAAARTMAGVIMGTVAYMSPEQAQGREVDARSDIFSFGLVLYEMVTGKQAFSAPSNIQLLNEIIAKPIPSLALEKTTLPLDLEKIVRKTTEKKPEDRYKSSQDLAADLKELLRKVETDRFVPITPPGVAEKIRSFFRGKNFYLTVAAIGVIAIIISSYFVGTQWKFRSSRKPAVAVLYFENLSPDKEADAYFRDGMTEDIITELSKIKGITVLLRGTIAPYKDKSVTAKELKADIGADYILEGSIQKAKDKLRINARLIDAASESSIWADNYDMDLQNVFNVQSDISRQIASALKVKITKEDEDQLAKKGTTNLEAYNNYLKGKAFSYKFTKNNIEPAIKLFEKAIELDPKYSLAYSALSSAYSAMNIYFDPDDIWLDKAEEAAKKAVALDSSSPEAHAALSEALRLKWKYDEALEEIKKEAELRPESEDFLTEYHNNLGMIFSDKGQKDQAIEQFRIATSFNRPAGWMAHAHLANALREQGKFDEALKEADTAIEMHPDHEQPYREKARILIDKEDHAEAEKLLKKSIEIAPDNISPYEPLIDIYKRQSKYAEAEKIMQNFIENYPYVMGGYLALKGVYDAMGKADAGIMIMEEAIRKNPDRIWPYRRLGVVYFRLRKYADAIKIFEDGLKIRDDGTLHNNIGFSYFKLGDMENAKISFEQAIRLNPSYHAAYFHLGELYEYQEKYDLAEENFKKAIEIKADIDDYYLKLGMFLQKVGRYKEIISFLEELERKQPNNRVLINALGGAYFNLFDYENAAKSFRRTIEINPQAELHNNLGITLIYLEKFAEAEAEFKKALEMKPDYVEAHYQIDLLQIYRNDLRKAEEMLQEDAKRFPNESRFYDRLGYIYVILGRCAEAMKQFEKVEELEPQLVRCGVLSICYRNTLDPQKADQLITRSMERAKEILSRKTDEIDPLMGLMQCNALQGKESEALEVAEKLGKLEPMKKNYFIAGAYSLLGKPDLALKHLRMAKEDGVRNFIDWKWDINLLPLKDHPEFKKLLK